MTRCRTLAWVLSASIVVEKYDPRSRPVFVMRRWGNDDVLEDVYR